MSIQSLQALHGDPIMCTRHLVVYRGIRCGENLTIRPCCARLPRYRGCRKLCTTSDHQNTVIWGIGYAGWARFSLSTVRHLWVGSISPNIWWLWDVNFARYGSAGLPFSESLLGNLNQLATKCVFTEVYIYTYIIYLVNTMVSLQW